MYNNFESRFTQKAATTLKHAQQCALELGHSYIGSEHMLVGLLREGTGVAAQALRSVGVTEEKIIEKIVELIGTGNTNGVSFTGFTPRSKKILEISMEEAALSGEELIGTEHILLAILKEGRSLEFQLERLRHNSDSLKVQTPHKKEQHIHKGKTRLRLISLEEI